MFDAAAFSRVEDWMYRNARPLEMEVWKVLFEDENPADAVQILKRYQNTDGGFGYALEPDSWNSNSTPYTTLYAANVLQQIGFLDARTEIYEGIASYLRSGKDFSPDTGWNFSVASSDAFPHAPWWTCNDADNAVESIGLTAEICRVIFERFSADAELLNTALDIAHGLFSKIKKPLQMGNMAINGYCVLLETAGKKRHITKSEYQELFFILKKYVKESIEYDTRKWKAHVVRPSNYIRAPSSAYYTDNKEIMTIELDYIVQSVNADGVWDIDWSWFENNERYAAQFAIAENWWKSIKAIETISLLDAFDRLD